MTMLHQCLDNTAKSPPALPLLTTLAGASDLHNTYLAINENLTDDEVDELIRLCDHDGDGQVGILYTRTHTHTQTHACAHTYWWTFFFVTPTPALAPPPSNLPTPHPLCIRAKSRVRPIRDSRNVHRK